MKLRSAVVWGGAGCGRRAMAAAHSRAGSGHARRVGRLSDMQGVVGRYFAIFRALSVRISPDNPRVVRISPDNPCVVRIVPDNASTAQISPGNAAAQPRHDRRAKPPAPHRQLRTAGADPQPDRSAAKSSSPSHRHPRSHCAGCPLPCNRPPDRRSCLSAQSAQDCIQPN